MSSPRVTPGSKGICCKAAFALLATVFAMFPRAVSSPAGVKVAPAGGGMNFYFGSLHGHSANSDGTGTPEEVFAWARDTAGFDFYALTDHAEQLTPEEWEENGEQADLFNQDGSFTAIRGFEWTSGTYGHVNVWDTEDFTSASLLPELDSLYQWLDTRDARAQFNHPGIFGNDFNGYARVESVADNVICQETANKFLGNGGEHFFPQFISALDQGWRMAPTGNQDNHELSAYSHRTVIVAPELTRSSLMESLEARRVYSSDDPGMKVDFRCNGAWMGSEVKAPGGTASFSVSVEDDEPILRLQIIGPGGAVVDYADDDGTWSDGTAEWYPVLQVDEPSYFFLRAWQHDVNGDEGEWIDYQAAVTAPVWVTPSAFESYFAEGYTGQGFQEYLCLGNPGDYPVEAVATFLFPDGSGSERSFELPARSRTTVDVNALVGEGREVSVAVESQSEFVAERPMYFSYGPGWTGGSNVLGAPSPSHEWYFAEGCTGEGFDEWICVLNPGDSDAALTFRFQTQEEGEKVVEGHCVPEHSRATFKVNELLGEGYQSSLKLEADAGVVAERPMFFEYRSAGGERWTGGHCVTGVTALSTRYFLAEGTTRSGFEEWLTLQNPGSSAITVHASYLPGEGQGEPVEKDYTVQAGSRSTVFVPAEVGAEKDVSVELGCASPFLAERPMYFAYGGDGWSAAGGHCVSGCAASSTRWFFAEGYTGEWFEEWLCLQNPGDGEVSLDLTYYPETGAPVTRTHLLAPRSRYTVRVDEDCGEGLALSMVLEAGGAVFAERPMYFRFRGAWGGGHVAAGYLPLAP